MIWFLRLFPAYRELELQFTNARFDLSRSRSDCDSLEASNMQYRASAEQWHDRCEKWEQKYDDQVALTLAAKDKETASTQAVADWASEKITGRSIYNKAPALPETSERPQPILKARIQGRDAVRQAEAKFRADMAEYSKKQTPVQ